MKTIADLHEEISSKEKQIIQNYINIVQKYWESEGLKMHPIAGLGIQTDVYNISFIYSEGNRV